jgi:hypothetical protein
VFGGGTTLPGVGRVVVACVEFACVAEVGCVVELGVVEVACFLDFACVVEVVVLLAAWGFVPLLPQAQSTRERASTGPSNANDLDIFTSGRLRTTSLCVSLTRNSSPWRTHLPRLL